MAKFYTVLSGKGGVGKTTTAVNLGHIMDRQGHDAIVVDGNLSSPNLSLHLGTPYFPITLHDVMANNHRIQNAVYEHDSGVKIIPADLNVSSMRLIDFETLGSHLNDLHLISDYVVLDGSPGLGRETTELIKHSDEVIVVVNPDKPSVYDAKRLIDLVKHFDTPIAGVVLTKHKRWWGNNLSKDDVEQALGVPILATIPHDKRFKKSLRKQTPYTELYPRRRAAKAYRELASYLTNTF